MRNLRGCGERRCRAHLQLLSGSLINLSVRAKAQVEQRGRVRIKQDLRKSRFLCKLNNLADVIGNASAFFQNSYYFPLVISDGEFIERPHPAPEDNYNI